MEYKLSASYERMSGFYSLPKNTLDIVFIGTSHLYCGIVPMKLWEDYGITSYVLAQQQQIIECSYAYINEVLKYQSPKLIVLDIYSLLSGHTIPSINIIRKSIDYMKWGMNKLKLIEELVKDEDMYEYFNNYLNHDTSKYIETTYEDMNERNEFITGEIYSISTLDKFKRFLYCQVIHARAENVEYHGKSKLKDEMKSYLKKIIKKAQKENIDILCTNMPYLLESGDWEETEDLENFLKDKGVHFLDFNRHNNVQIDLNTDFIDDGHLNYGGAKKVTKYIGEYIMKNYNIKFEDKRNNAEYKVWNDYSIKHKKINEDIIQKLLNQNKCIKRIGNIFDKFEEKFNIYIENNIDIKDIYFNRLPDEDYLDIKLVKLENEKDYSMKLDYKLNINDYVLIRRVLVGKEICDWSNKKGIEIVLMSDNSKRDFIVQITSSNGVYLRQKVQLSGSDEKKVQIMFKDLEKVDKNDKREFNYNHVGLFEIGVSTQWNGDAGEGSIIIKSIKLL